MAPITTIVHFQVPARNGDRFLAFWQDSISQHNCAEAVRYGPLSPCTRAAPD